MALAEAKKKKRHIFNPVRTGETRGLAEIISVARSDPKSFAEKMEKLVTERKLGLRDINIRDVFHGLKGLTVPVFETTGDGQQRAMMASAFPLLSGLLMIAELEDAYEEVPTIGDELVTDFEDPKQVTVIMRLLTLDSQVDKVDEAKDYPEIGASEESYEVLAKRNGRKLSVTQEMIDQNDVPNIVERINKLAEIATDFVEEDTLAAVCDKFGSPLAGGAGEPYVLRPRVGGPTGLFQLVGGIGTLPQGGIRAPSGTKITGNALVDGTNLAKLRLVLSDMRNDRGKHMSMRWSETTLLVPNALLDTALYILGSEHEPGVVGQLNNWGPRGQFRPKLISSPRLDDISTSAYYMGSPKRQFRRKWKTNFEYVTLGADQQRFLDARIAFQARIGWEMGINAVDYNRWVQSTP